ncbi:MAG: transketolase-like TK C-terminal-containing protein, partial [Candidatus Limnocylindria bacterium]
PYVRQCLDPTTGPIVAATDYMKAVPDMVSRWIDRPYTVLGTDGFGRSDTREALRTHFEVNAEHITYAALHSLCLDGKSTPDELKRAIGELGIDPERVNPLYA